MRRAGQAGGGWAPRGSRGQVWPSEAEAVPHPVRAAKRRGIPASAPPTLAIRDAAGGFTQIHKCGAGGPRTAPASPTFTHGKSGLCRLRPLGRQGVKIRAHKVNRRGQVPHQVPTIHDTLSRSWRVQTDVMSNPVSACVHMRRPEPRPTHPETKLEPRERCPLSTPKVDPARGESTPG